MSPSRVKAVLDGRYVGWKSLNHTVSDKISGEARVVAGRTHQKLNRRPR